LKCVDISDVALENEADYIAELIPSRSILFVDGYQFDENYLRGVSSKGAFLICMESVGCVTKQRSLARWNCCSSLRTTI
jgi:hypothetical protein